MAQSAFISLNDVPPPSSVISYSDHSLPLLPSKSSIFGVYHNEPNSNFNSTRSFLNEHLHLQIPSAALLRQICRLFHLSALLVLNPIIPLSTRRHFSLAAHPLSLNGSALHVSSGSSVFEFEDDELSPPRLDKQALVRRRSPPLARDFWPTCIPPASVWPTRLVI